MSGAMIAMLLVGATGAVLLTTRPPAVPADSGDLEAAVRALVGRMPGPGSGGYVQPTDVQRATMADAYRAVADGRLGDAQGLVRGLGYEVKRFTDTATGRPLIVLQEAPGTAQPRGWGIYVYSPGATSPLLVEVPHPFDDLDTGPVGVQTFRTADARVLFIAGTSRYASRDGVADMAHDAFTVFEAVHEAALSSNAIVVEPHGFELGAHPTDGAAVVSSGVETPDATARAVASAFERRGYAVCLYDGGNCAGLGATTNVQGVSTRAVGATFLHIELSLALRRSTSGRVAVARAVATSLPYP